MKTVFYNGKLLTLDDGESGSALLAEDGIIKTIGSDAEILSRGGGNAGLIDLDGRTLMPAFIDAHSHLTSCASSYLQASLEGANSFDDIVARLKLFEKESGLQDGRWLIASGYDHNGLTEKAHPTKELLDSAFPGVAVVLKHKSGHFGVFSSAALRETGFEGRDSNGYLEENVYVEAIRRTPLPDGKRLLSAYKRAFANYASYGITTVQEGMLVSQLLPLYKALLDAGAAELDVVGYPQLSEAGLFYSAFPKSDGAYDRNFKLGGYKIILDGSPQGRTAWMRTPYAGTEDYFGVSSMSDSEVTSALKKAVIDHRQLLAHCNGDAAAAQLLRCAESIGDNAGIAAIRPVMIHAQLLGVDQLDEVKALGIIPSFFAAHCYYWGDTHIRNFGFDRASRISPAASALKKGILFTFHQDSPVLEPDMFRTIWCAANRLTESGVLLGADERIPVLEAIRAVTINAACQYGEENAKGSLTTGKRADLIVVDRPPLEIPPSELASVKILQTYKSGVRVYEA